MPYVQQTNGKGERAIQTIVTIGRSLLHHEKLDRCFWAEAAMTAIHIMNRLLSPKIDQKTSFEIVYNSKPSVKHMRAFICQAYILTARMKRLMWDPKTCIGIFIGYEEASKAYRVYDIEAGLVVISRDNTVDESTCDFRWSDEVKKKLSMRHWSSIARQSAMTTSTNRMVSARIKLARRCYV